ncbi:MAG: SMC-Scp complex subunit ScpB [Planctomycetaceae bacterium]
MTETRFPEDASEHGTEDPADAQQSNASASSPDEDTLNGWQLTSEDDEASAGDEDWPAEDLESAYRRALEANNSVEWEFARIPGDPETDSVSGDIQSDVVVEQEPEAGGGVPPVVAQGTAGLIEKASERVSARQLIEAALFVGGDSLTTKRLCFMLRGDYDLDYIEDTIGNLNQQYEQEARPYEIRLGEGGYRLVLHDEFQRIRNRVFGVGPREIRLSQSVLEVLALVAYRQPVSQKEIEDQVAVSCGTLLRQLLRRELIAIQRDDGNRKIVDYVTTRRFLSVFGLGSISELPQADELGFR